MSVFYTVQPASGDSVASIFKDKKMTEKIGQLQTGMSIVIVGESNSPKAYEIAFKWNSGSSESADTRIINGNGGTVDVWAKPGGSSNSPNHIVTKLSNGTKVKLIDAAALGVYLPSGWCAINSGSINGFCPQSALTTASASGDTAWISYSDVNASAIDPDSEWNDESFAEDLAASESNLVYFNNYLYDPNDPSNGDYWRALIEKINHCFGCPPKYNMDIDIQYEDIGSGIGRVMGNTFYSNPTILSICPGKVKLFPGLFGVKKDKMFDRLMALAGGNDSLVTKIANDDNAKFTGKMYTFTTDTAGFAKRVNLLCRSCAILLGIGDRVMPQTTTKLKAFDYAYWSIRKVYRPGANDDKDGSIFKNFYNAGMDAIEGAVTDKNYIHYIISNSSTQVSENISTDTSENQLMGALKSVNNMTATLSYFLGTGFTEQQDFGDAISSALSDVVGTNGWTKLADNLLKGGQMVFPNQISGVNYSQSISCSVNFVSPYGDPLGVFLWCIVPVMHLMALALPKQVADNMYTFPFLCRVCQKGWFNSNLCVISDLQIQRGGGDDTSWTVDGLATDWTVSFSVVPLITSLMVTSTDNPFLFMKNDGLIDYLGNLCSFDLKANNLKEKEDLFLTFSTNKATDLLSGHGLQRWISDSLAGRLNDLFQF